MAGASCRRRATEIARFRRSSSIIAAQMRRLVLLLLLVASAANAQQPVFRWGGDAEGGAPFVEADPNDPSRLRGFDVEVAEQIAKGLGKRPEFVQVSFSDIDQSVQRG